MWVSRMTASLRSLGNDLTLDLAAEEALSATNDTFTARSVMSRASILIRNQANSFVTNVQEEQLHSVMNRNQSTRRSILQLKESQLSLQLSMWQQKRPDLENKWEEREAKIKELERTQTIQQQALQQARKQIHETTLKYQKESQEWRLTKEDYLAQTHRLNERIEAYDRDLHDEDVMHMLEGVMSNGAQDSDGEGKDLPPAPNVQQENDDETVVTNKSNKSNKSNRSNFSLPSWGMGFNKQQQQQQQRDDLQQQAELVYMELLQTKLLKAKHKMQVIKNQCEMLEEMLEEETKILRNQLKLQEQDKSNFEHDLNQKLCQEEFEHKLKEQQFLAKLEAKQERINRMEDLLDELREAADLKAHGALDMEEFASIIALNSMKESFDVLSAKKDVMETELVRQINFFKGEVNRLQNANEKLEKWIERLESGDTLTVLEHDTTTVPAADNAHDNDNGVASIRRSDELIHSSFRQESIQALQPTISTQSLAIVDQPSIVVEPRSNDNSIDGFLIPSELKAELSELMDSISIFAETELDSLASERTSSLDHYGRPSEHPVEINQFRKQSMQIQEGKWATMDDDRRRKQQKRMSRFL